PLSEVLLQALSKDPADRYPSVADMAAVFEEASALLLTAPSSPVVPFSQATNIDGSEAKGARVSAWLGSVLSRVSDATAPLPVQGIRYPIASVTYGSSGIAYGLYRIACARGDAGLFALADRWLDRANSEINEKNAFYEEAVEILPETVGHISFYH